MCEEIEYSYWEVWFISCEGNERWTNAKTLNDVSSYELEGMMLNGGCGDDPAEITSVREVTPFGEEVWYSDFT